MRVPVPVSPLLAFFLCASGVKLRFCMMRKGVGGNSIVAWRNVTGGPGRGRGPLGALRTHSFQQTHKHKLASQKTATHTHTHNHILFLSFQSRFVLHTHSPPWCQHTLWSRFLDDVVKQLHGLHDVLILFA